jgi:hyperosmotically inducible periplasmic protein
MRASNNTLRNLAMTVIVSTAAACATESGYRTAGAVVDDAVITTGVKAQLIGDEETKARQINVSTSSGVVQLDGFVDSASAKAEAGRLARSVDGVKRVQNNLDVQAGTRSFGTVVDDTTITAKVEAKLAADQRTSALSIDVGTREGVVQLGGFATSSTERRAAEELAMTVEGVRTVENNIAIR